MWASEIVPRWFLQCNYGNYSIFGILTITTVFLEMSQVIMDIWSSGWNNHYTFLPHTQKKICSNRKIENSQRCRAIDRQSFIKTMIIDPFKQVKLLTTFRSIAKVRVITNVQSFKCWIVSITTLLPKHRWIRDDGFLWHPARLIKALLLLIGTGTRRCVNDRREQELTWANLCMNNNKDGLSSPLQLCSDLIEGDHGV